MSKLMYNHNQQYIQSKDGIFYFVRRVPVDVQPYYSSKRISFSLKTRSLNRAMRACNSILQRLEDYWLGLRLQKMDIPAIHLVMPDAAANESNAPLLSDALDLYLKLKGVGKDKVFIRTATRNVEYVVKVLGNRYFKFPIIIPPTPNKHSYDASLTNSFTTAHIAKPLSRSSVRVRRGALNV